MKRMLLALALVVAVAGLSACNAPKAPDAAPAQASIDASKAAGADTKAAEDKMAAAKGEIDKQNKKFSMMRDYKAADAMLADAKGSADKALADKKAADEEAAKKKAEEEAAKKAKGKKAPAKKKM